MMSRALWSMWPCTTLVSLGEILLTYFLVIIDKLAGGDGCHNKLLDGTSSIYNEGHLIIKWHPPWVTIVRSRGYEYLALGHYMSSDGTRMKLWVPLHHMTCYLRWGGAGLRGTHVVCHDVACPHRHCLSPGCLRWGDPCDNAQDRLGRKYTCPRCMLGAGEEARTSEASPFMRCSCIARCQKDRVYEVGESQGRLPLHLWRDEICSEVA